MENETNDNPLKREKLKLLDKTDGLFVKKIINILR